MKKLFIFILLSLIFSGGGIATAQENICSVIDLKDNIVNKFTYYTSNSKHIQIDSNDDLKQVFSILNYYNDSIKHLHSLNCFDEKQLSYFNIVLDDYYIEQYVSYKKTNDIVYLEICLITFYNFLSDYNDKILK